MGRWWGIAFFGSASVWWGSRWRRLRIFTRGRRNMGVLVRGAFDCKGMGSMDGAGVGGGYRA